MPFYIAEKGNDLYASLS